MGHVEWYKVWEICFCDINMLISHDSAEVSSGNPSFAGFVNWLEAFP